VPGGELEYFPEQGLNSADARSSASRLLEALVMLVVFLISVGPIWRLISGHWSMSFLSTLEASVNAEKYGHPVEHAAESILVMLGCVHTDSDCPTAAGLAAAAIVSMSGCDFPPHVLSPTFPKGQ